MGVFFVFSILAKQRLINMPLENLKLDRRVMIGVFPIPIKKPDFNKQWNRLLNRIN